MSSNIYAFVIQNKKGETMLAVPNNAFRTDKALYLADRVYDKVILQFKSNSKVDRHFIIDHNIAGIIYITDQFIFQLFISSAHIAVGYDLIKKLVNAFNACKVLDASNMEKKIFEVYFMLHQSIYQKFIDHKLFNINFKNQYIKNAIEDKLCDKDVIKTRFGSMQQQQIGSTLSSKIFEERDAISVIPYKYAKKYYNNTKTNQFLQSFNNKIEIPTAVFNQNNHESKREAIRNKLYTFAFQMKVKSACSQSDSTRMSYPLNKSNLKFIDKLKPKIQSFSSQQMQLLKQKYGNKINHQIIQENIENQFNGIQFIQNDKNVKSDNNRSNGKTNIDSNKQQLASQSKDKNQINPVFVNNTNVNNNNINQQQQQNGLQHNNLVQSENKQQKIPIQQMQQQLQSQSNKHEDLLDFDFHDQLNDNSNKEDSSQHKNQQIQFFSNQQNNFINFPNQQQQEIDLI
ncbi:hypothetical protein TTHERM_00148990 (macronuclear) [Tetrahymena thermophila SB210]|uniref:Uncharacterized protein n=1 Tax=Tetrahymena thermophila (strain SB210) TaxID=312017 RepID=I7M2T9_TETTS|nr:hypothetical protein TTHERM_00148990 [Tetrahymena thermophila SB210]EAS01289.2 hypothetical protein TTHERM_00148990 [Tetrahymena thermophila SB210]|eukprot:XP_001021534.2 hypothetical protein TTHERM_00148990 [Tetrahymena thermophila SB210]